jgi:anti-sigma28 factor (negative regulator of flagellin synthesis)
MCRLLLVPPLLVCAFAHAQQPSVPPLTAETIMARVAANQDRSDSERAHYLYVQHAHIASRKGKTVRCEETTDYRVTPTAAGSDHRLLKLDGRLLQKKHYVTYTELVKPGTQDDKKPTESKSQPDSQKPVDTNTDDDKVEVHQNHVHVTLQDDGEDDMDRDLVENMRQNLTTDTKSKDGISANLFPLTSKEQLDYRFTLLGREPRNGRDCFHIAFRPKQDDDYGWKGDAWIDATAFQPVVLRTTMARKLPFAVRALLGTNVPGLGFTIVYAPQAQTQPDLTPGDDSKALWFPTSFGTEFKIHVLFFLNREIVFSAENRDFQKTHVTSTILDANSGTEKP